MNQLLDLLDCARYEPPLPPKHHSAYDAGSTKLTGYVDGETIDLDLQGDYSTQSSSPCIRKLVTLLNHYLSPQSHPRTSYHFHDNAIHMYL